MAIRSKQFRCGFYLLRHGQTHANRRKIRAGGDCDARMTALGRRQVHIAARHLFKSSVPVPGYICTANSARTIQTARIILGYADLKIVISKGLLERRLGDWNFRSYASTQKSIELRKKPPNGESEFEFRKRVLGAFSGLAVGVRHIPLVISSRGVTRILFGHIGCGFGDIENGQLYFVAVGQDPPFLISTVLNFGSEGPKEVWKADGPNRPVLLRNSGMF